MRVVGVVGIRKAGKTTTVTHLIEEYKKRGLKVGSVKSIFCPGFTMDEKGSNTWQHKQAGADVVVVRGKKEMNVILPPQREDDIYANLDVDILIVEGGYELVIPRVICAHTEEEVMERKDSLTLAVAGRIADKGEPMCQGYPVFHSITGVEALADYIWDHTEEEKLPIGRREMPAYASEFCKHCDKHGKKDSKGKNETK